MAKIKVSIVNTKTLRLEEAGAIGDTIDLQELHSVDNSLIIEAIKDAKDDIYKNLLEKEIQQQEAIKKIELNELEKKLKADMEGLRIEKEKLALIVNSIDEKVKTEKDATKTALIAEFSIEKNKLESKISELEKSIGEEKKIVALQTEKTKTEEFNLKIEELNKQLSDKEREITKLQNTL